MKTTNNHIRLSAQDWDTLKTYNAKITASIYRRLPADSGYTPEDISSEVYGTFISLLSEYKSGVISPTSYCWAYAERRAMGALMREYRQRKRQLDVSDMLEPDDDDCCHHQYGHGDIQMLSVDERERRAARMDAEYITTKATPEDKVIIEMILEGMTYQEISQRLGVSPSTISRRLSKYRRLA